MMAATARRPITTTVRILMLLLLVTQSTGCSTVVHTNPVDMLDIRQRVGSTVQVSTDAGDRFEGTLQEWNDKILVLEQNGVRYVVPIERLAEVTLIDDGSDRRSGNVIVPAVIVLLMIVLSTFHVSYPAD